MYILIIETGIDIIIEHGLLRIDIFTLTDVSKWASKIRKILLD